MHEITVKWPDGRKITRGNYDDETSILMMDLLWACGADDVYRTCLCGECDVCTDTYVFRNSEV